MNEDAWAASWRRQIIKDLKSEGWRIVKLQVEDTDSGGPEWTTYYVTEEL